MTVADYFWFVHMVVVAGIITSDELDGAQLFKHQFVICMVTLISHQFLSV